jgi:uncharacterized protein
MKKVFILHGWGDHYNKGWFPWLKKELELRGFETKSLNMIPQPPILNKWKNILKKACPKPDKNTYFIGHSASAMTILHYLSELSENTIIGGIVLVAGWTDDLEMEELQNFFKKELDWKKVKKHCKKFIDIYSDNDPYVKSYHAKVLKQKLGAKLILDKGKKHFSHEEEIDELHSVLNAVIEISKTQK